MKVKIHCRYGFSEIVKINSTYIRRHATEIINLNLQSQNLSIDIRRAVKITPQTLAARLCLET